MKSRRLAVRCSIVWLVAIGVLPILDRSQTSVIRAQESESEVASEPVSVLSETLPNGASPSTMTRDSLHREANEHFDRWREAYEARTEPEEIAVYQQRLKSEFVERIGGLPGSPPLRAEVTGTIEKDGYRVEKVLFESQPQFYVTAGLFLPDPDKFPPPWPAVVVVCGHSSEGKQQLGYQTGTALAALNGLAAMIVDPIGQGERLQMLTPENRSAIGGPTTEHTVLGTGAILVGWNTARWMIGDAMAAIDYLQSRDDIRGDRIGCMGNSGGGTQTSYLMALDDRVTAAAPSCYITSFRRLLETIGPQDAEQNIYGQIALGMDHADYLMMRAPKPTLINCATRDFFDISGTWGAFRDAKRLFQRLDAGLNLDLIEVDATHGWHPMIRRASVQFMVRHLAGRIDDFVEPEIIPLSVEEMNVTPEGQVLRLPGAVSAFDHVRAESERLKAEREIAGPAPAALRQTVRQVAMIGELANLAEPRIELADDVTIGELNYQRLIVEVDEDVWLPGLLARPESDASDAAATEKSVTCLLLGGGKAEATGAGGEIERRVARGETVLAIDLRGVGETAPVGQRWYHQRFGANGGNSVLAYLLGKSLVGLRAEDCLKVVRWLAHAEGVTAIDVVASGELSTPVLHAAALEPDLFGSLELRQGPASWAAVAAAPERENQVAGLVHGALRHYDLPDLASLIADRLTVREAE